MDNNDFKILLAPPYTVQYYNPILDKCIVYDFLSYNSASLFIDIN